MGHRIRGAVMIGTFPASFVGGVAVAQNKSADTWTSSAKRRVRTRSSWWRRRLGSRNVRPRSSGPSRTPIRAT